MCEGERHWAGFYAGCGGVGHPWGPWPWGILEAAALVWPNLAGHEVGNVFLHAGLQFHVLLLMLRPPDLGGYFNTYVGIEVNMIAQYV